MALSIDSIYKPLNDFFLNHFQTDEDNPVFFRFCKLGNVIQDDQPVDANQARESFSNLVNNIPVENSDGQNILFTQNNIDETYHDRLLGPSIPFIPSDSSDDVKTSIINTFSGIKAAALRDWDNIKLESSSGLMMEYWPSLATPDNWYDKTKDDQWTPYSFHTEETTAPPSTDAPKFQIWKMRLSDDQLIQALPVLNTAQPVKPTVLVNPNVMKTITLKTAMAPKAVIAQPATRATAVTTLARPAIATAQPVSPLPGEVATMDPARFPVHQNFHNAFWGLDVKNRVLVSQYIKTQAPTQPVNSNSFSISFKYCVITIDRPWLKTSFINDTNWFIPNTKKGALTGTDDTGGNISEMPIAFIAVKDLNIEANWSNTDIEIAKNATDFGPFLVDSQIVNNKLSHAGIQIIGWMLQKMPDLPPNDSQ
jgi:hypothetical protein